jgi:hypothetical protein
VWTDGIYRRLRAERQRLCTLVVVGVNARGEKHFLAIEDGIRESTQSWREVLLDLKARGLNASELAVGDGFLVYDDSSPHDKNERLRGALQSFTYDVQARSMCREELEKVKRCLPSSRPPNHRAPVS